MRARFFLPVLWLLMLWQPVPRLRAQGRPLGPWRWTTQVVPERNDDGWGFANPTNHKKALQTVAIAAHWNVEPDSIRLFLNCENPLVAPPRPRKGQLPIRFSASGATVRVDSKSCRLLIAPTTTSVTLWAHKGRALVFKHQFRAIPPPLPKIECYVGVRRPTDTRPGEDWQPSLALKAIPSISFSSLLPDDARFRVSHSILTLLRNGVAFGAPRDIAGPQASLAEASYFQPGDRLQIDVQLVQRMNFRGKVEDMVIQKHFNVPLLFPEPSSGLPPDSTSGW